MQFERTAAGVVIHGHVADVQIVVEQDPVPIVDFSDLVQSSEALIHPNLYISWMYLCIVELSQIGLCSLPFIGYIFLKEPGKAINHTHH